MNLSSMRRGRAGAGRGEGRLRKDTKLLERRKARKGSERKKVKGKQRK